MYLPALCQRVVAEMQNELVKRIRLLSDLLLLLLLHLGLRLLDKYNNMSAEQDHPDVKDGLTAISVQTRPAR